jgi:hypothetical protein
MALISAINGFEGRVELVGARAVAAMFQRWSLRREGPGDDSWALHAVLSYQKDVLLKHPKFTRRVVIKEHTSGVWYEVRLPAGQEPVVNGESLTIKGASLCRTDPTGRP